MVDLRLRSRSASTAEDAGTPEFADDRIPGDVGSTERRRSASHEHRRRISDPRPLAGYAVLLASYGGMAACLTIAIRRRSDQVKPLRYGELLLFGLATQHISRILTKDSVTSVLRAPMVSFDGPAGDGEVNEQVIGDGLRHAAGELMTCPFCLAQWVATALVAGRALAPTVTSGIVAVSAVARISDYLQLAYDGMK